MNRITPLNDDSENSSSDEEEPKITKEAEETIAVSEYMRALKIKNENRIDDALKLFSELLETQVLHEITKDNKDNKLFYIKYNCYKNIGFIYKEKGDNHLALEHLLSAFELDDTDVFTMHKFGQLALHLNKPEIALIVFEKCLKQNPNHWPSADGILQVLCLREDYNEAYGWALLWYDKDNNYQRGLDVILEIREKFQHIGFDYIERSWQNKFTHTDLKRTNDKSVFPEYSCIEPAPLKRPNISEFKLEEFTWLTFAKLIVDFYTKFEEDSTALCYSFNFTEFLVSENTVESTVTVQNEENPIEDKIAAQSTNVNGIDVDAEAKNDGTDGQKSVSKENSNSSSDIVFVMPSVCENPTGMADASAEDSDFNSKQDIISDGKPRAARRRGSDLSFLEQWGWHKNKKYARARKKSYERDPDQTVDGILKRILAKHFVVKYTEESPFSIAEQSFDLEDHIAVHIIQPTFQPTNCEDFQNQTKESFNEFFNDIKQTPFDIMILLQKWAQHISVYWEQSIPIELQEFYIKIYVFYINHFDLATWNLLDRNEFKAAFRMTLLYLELYHDRIVKELKFGTKHTVNQRWFLLYNHVLFYSGFFEIENDELEFSKYKKRLYWLQYCLAKHEYDLQRAVDCLYTLDELIRADNQRNFKLDFPNQLENNRIDLATIGELKTTLERSICLNNVKRLYDQLNYAELVIILKDSLINCVNFKTPNDHNPIIKITTQFEVLLEALWTMESYEDCLIWAERCLNFALDHFLCAPSDTFRQTEWADCVSFILTYIESLVLNESIWIVKCLEKYYSRLVQNLTKIVVHQLDVPFDKNNNPIHPINTKMPWIILHLILQREEDLALAVAKKTTEQPNDGEEPDESIPNSVIIFFTAHEFLGLRSWCTKHDGQLLLYALDTVGTRLRAPAFESCRDIIAEYLEQVTYCLYGYPAKRARARHIEEHDAHNIELNWERGVQLFDLYRPDSLPEYNSYKNDSISADMEQLLQRILNLIPIDIDPNSHASAIKDYIDGTTNDLPQPYVLLPYRISCIYYLLADHYFKNRDFSKSVKYYMLDLTICPNRLDSWAGLALSKASKLETKLNSCALFGTNDFLAQCEEALRCFVQCFKLDDRQVPLWIEYGNFSYTMHSFCSRSLKQSSATLSMERFEFMEEKKEQCLKIASECFTTVDQSQHNTESDDGHDERWLHHYMLGKISEKRKEQPDIQLNHYIKSAKFLYENNASYPFKISHSNPQNLSVEALEIYYRITSSIVKHVEQHSTVTKALGKLFLRTLKEVNASPFALNQAKIDDTSINALKRKISIATEDTSRKIFKTSNNNDSKSETPIENGTPKEESDVEAMDTNVPSVESSKPDNTGSAVNSRAPTPQLLPPPPTVTPPAETQPGEPNVEHSNVNSPSRRGSQESNATTTTTGTATTTTTGSDSTTSSSTDSSSSESSSSETESESSDDDGHNATLPIGENELESIYKTCIKNLEECVTRFPEHYKSIYRLVNIYLNAPDKIKDLRKCKQLLLGSYTTGLGNQIQGLFVDRKINNFFNGVWRIPSSEIDRPGSFSAHLSKCIIVLMEVLRLSSDHKILLELALQLQRNPDSDKRYIRDAERKELFQQAISFCVQSFRRLLKEHGTDNKDDNELLLLIIEVFKAHKKCVKHMIQKENIFSSLLIDTYKSYIEGKIRLPDNVNYLDLAIKLCQYEIGARKNPNKIIGMPQMITMSEQTFSIGNSVKPAISFPSPISATDLTITTTAMSTIVSTSTTSAVAITTNKPIPSITPISVTIPSTAATSIPAVSISSIPSTTTTAPFLPGLPRPRGRPPGSKNYISHTPPSTMANTNLTAQNPYLNRMDAASMSMAMMSMYNNPALMAQYSDPNAVTALLNEFYKLSNMTGMSSMLPGLGQTGLGLSPQSPLLPSVPSLPSPTSSTAKLPQFDIKNLISSATSLSAAASTAAKTPTSTIITVGSGQLTITPSTTTAKTSISQNIMTKGNYASLIPEPKQYYDPKLQIPSKTDLTKSVSQISSTIFNDMPGISVTKVKPSTSSPQSSSNLNMPKALPKSLTITPAPAGYTGKPSNVNQYPQVTLQPEILPKPQAKAKKPKQTKRNSAPANTTSTQPFGRTMPQQFPPNSTAYNAMNEFTQQMAVLNQYSDLMKSMDSTQSAKLLAQFQEYSKLTKATSKTSKQAKSATVTAAATQNSVIPSTMPTTGKGRVSVKQLYSLQNQQTPPPSPNSTASSYSSIVKSNQSQNKIPSQQTFNIPDVPRKSNSPYMSTSPSLAHSNSPSKSSTSLPPPRQSITPPAHTQISPTKTLQQILAERQKALNDANQLQQARAASASGSSTGNSSNNNKKGLKNDSVIILD